MLHKRIKVIPQQYFETLKEIGHVVARYEKTGEVIPFSVGDEYNVKGEKSGEILKVRCTQDCPHAIKIIN